MNSTQTTQYFIRAFSEGHGFSRAVHDGQNYGL